MKTLVLSAAFATLLGLGACGDVAPNAENPSFAEERAERIEEKTAADLSKMEVSEIIDFVNDEAEELTILLQSVTDGPSAEAAVEKIRVTIPRLNASIQSMQNMDLENVTLNFGNARRMIQVAQSQSGLINEVVRIGNIPEARAVLQKEFDKIEISNN